jgi:hypothetical protein
MYFPWIGMLQQIRSADVYVFYNDVQFSRGGFLNRVQVKTRTGSKWMTVPLRDQRLGQLIHDVTIDDRSDWRKSHIELLTEAYADTPHWKDVKSILFDVFSRATSSLSDIAEASTLSLVDYFDLRNSCHFLRSSDLNISGRSTQRVVDICSHLGAKTYLTGHGARNYLQHDAFEARNMLVSYINYNLSPYQQMHGAFTPYVTALDLVANCGRGGSQFLVGSAQDWRTFLASHPSKIEQET